jgi:hypothetical protein
MFFNCVLYNVTALLLQGISTLRHLQCISPVSNSLITTFIISFALMHTDFFGLVTAALSFLSFAEFCLISSSLDLCRFVCFHMYSFILVRYIGYIGSPENMSCDNVEHNIG